MTMALIGKNKIGFVDGSIIPPSPQDPQYRLWLRNNNIVASRLLNSVSKEITASVVCSSLTSEIWKELQDLFQQGNGPRIFQLKRNLVSCTQGTLSVTQYYIKIKSIWEELGQYKRHHTCNCGGVQPLLEYVMNFLLGLNESYNHIRGQILIMNPIPPIAQVFSLMLQEEKQREVRNVHVDTESQLAYAVQSGHRSRNKKDRPLCAHCGMLGHTKDKCFKLHGYPPGHKKGRQSVNHVSESSNGSSSLNTSQIQQMITFLQD